MNTEGRQCQIEGCEGIRIGDQEEYGVTSHIPFCQGCLDKIHAQMAYNKIIKETVNKYHPTEDNSS